MHEIAKEPDSLICCPCPSKTALAPAGAALVCSDPQCVHHQEAGGFRYCAGTPVLISFEKCDTVCRPEVYDRYDRERSAYVSRKQGRLVGLLRAALHGTSRETRDNCSRFVELLKALDRPARVLVIGAGERGSGTDALWQDDGIAITGTDIYPSASVDYIADAHYLPFNDRSFDGVWIQAVLEHVADPNRVVGEIERVLTEDGLVYAETPFMQQVHEGAYDFQRFTVLGHRYLFRRFELIAMGGNQGPGVVLGWAIRYFTWAVARNRSIATVASLPFLWLFRLLDGLVDKRSLWDGASGVFFLGRKSDISIRQNELPGLYRGMQQ